MASNPVELSIIIPAYNEATYIDRLLEALTKQSYKNFEVIVSDAQSGDGTAEVVKSFEDKLNVKFIESPPNGPGAGRNVGAKISSGEWLLFLDADNDIDDPDFIKKMLDKTQEKGWKTSSAKIKINHGRFYERVGMAINYRYLKLLSHTKHPVAPGYCILTNHEVFEKNNGFNDVIQFGEDYDYVSRASLDGFGFVEDTYYYIDLRRSREEGLHLAAKAVLNEIYRHTHHYKLDKNPIKYEFGKHKERK
jgi:glycosyltransferase involved in cell wall biosynthesis